MTRCEDKIDGQASKSGSNGSILVGDVSSICQQLRLGTDVEKNVLHLLRIAQRQYVLEGDQNGNIVCAIYSAYYLLRDSDLPDLLLTDLLKISCVSLLQFFDHIKRWIRMVPINRRIRDQIRGLESCFGVATILFKKYEDIMLKVFAPASENAECLSSFSDLPVNHVSEDPKPKRRKVINENGISRKLLYDFCWKWFVYLKGEMQDSCDDLVTAFHLLLCCVDCVIIDAYNAGLSWLFTEEYNDLVYSSENDDIPPSLLGYLCHSFDGIVVEAKRIRTYWFVPTLQRLIKGSVLDATVTATGNVVGIVDRRRIERNTLQLNSKYTRHLVHSGEVDERIFLSSDNGAAEIGSPYKQNPCFSDGELLLRKSVQACLDRVMRRLPPTPLSGRQHHQITTAESCFHPVTPVASATQAVEKLLCLIADVPFDGPSSGLITHFRKCPEDAGRIIENRVSEMSILFDKYYAKNAENLEIHICHKNAASFSDQRLITAKRLYWHLLENIVRFEENRSSDAGMLAVLTEETFHRSLFACCLQAIMFSYNVDWPFPEILEVFDVAAYNFYKVIELMIRAEPELPRELVKHLSQVEERVIEELAWYHGSPLWVSLNQAQSLPPAYEDIAPSGASSVQLKSSLASPLSGKKELRMKIPEISPLSVERYHMTPERNSQGPAKRKLEFEAPGLEGVTAKSVPQTALPTARNLMAVPITLPCGIGGQSSDKASTSAMELPAKAASSVALHTAKHTGSLGLFFRKVYSLCHVRLLDLCRRLSLDEHFQQETWTLIEWIIRHTTDIMMDRHLDQIIISSIYVTAKIARKDRSFQEILFSYRSQPQARSRVYRNVLLERKPVTPVINVSSSGCGRSNAAENDGSDAQEKEACEIDPERQGTTTNSCTGKGDNAVTASTSKLRSPSTMPVPSITSAPPTPTPMEEERADLIKFYNQVFVRRVEAFVQDFMPSLDRSEICYNRVPLSPLPKVSVTGLLSPIRKVADSVFVSPMKPQAFPLSPRPVQYSFTHSPRKDLQAINSMIRSSSRRISITESTSSAVRKLNLVDVQSSPTSASLSPVT